MAFTRRMIPALAVLALASLSQDANAAPPRPRGELDGGAYVQGSPGPVAVVIDEHKFARDARWAWPWSIGAGRMFTWGPAFKAAIGATLEHRMMFFEDATAHNLHAFVESRIGAGNNRVWGYGLLGVGAAATLVDWGTEEDPLEDFYGVVMQFGGGLQAMVGRRFFLGGELDFDVAYYFSAYDELRSWDSFYYQMVAFELSLGWYF